MSYLQIARRSTVNSTLQPNPDPFRSCSTYNTHFISCPPASSIFNSLKFGPLFSLPQSWSYCDCAVNKPGLYTVWWTQWYYAIRTPPDLCSTYTLSNVSIEHRKEMVYVIIIQITKFETLASVCFLLFKGGLYIYIYILKTMLWSFDKIVSR